MPRGGGGAYQLPPNVPDQQANTTIQSSWGNSFSSDVETAFNTTWPLAYLPTIDIAHGGTGATNASDARDALGLEIGGDIPSLNQAQMYPRRNRIVNHDMRVSQENGTTSGTSNGYYPVDQWAQYRVTSAGTLTVQQVASVTPAGSPNRLRATVTVADASLAAGEYWTISQNLEGSNVVDFQYGSANAKNIVLRFGFKGPAGTYGVALHNSAANRSYVAMFTISGGEANTDTVQNISIPGDTTGTWLTADGVIGLTLDIVLACGSTFQGTTGWQSGNILGTSAVSNGMGTGAAVFELFDVGLKLDPDATGVYGQYEAGEVHPVYRSERYAERLYFANTTIVAIGQAFSTTTADWTLTYSRKSKAPSSVSVSTDFRALTSTGTFASGTATHTASAFSINQCKVRTVHASGLSTGNASGIYSDGDLSIFIPARLS